MKYTVTNELLGTVEVNESIWTGKKELFLNGQPVQKVSNKVFALPNGEQIFLNGNTLSGITLQYGTENIRVSPRPKWYEIALSILPFILVLVWGSSRTLCEIVPVVGGAIGGGISAIGGVLNFVAIKNVRSVTVKILISIGVLALTFLICFLIGLAIVSATH